MPGGAAPAFVSGPFPGVERRLALRRRTFCVFPEADTPSPRPGPERSRESRGQRASRHPGLLPFCKNGLFSLLRCAFLWSLVGRASLPGAVARPSRASSLSFPSTSQRSSPTRPVSLPPGACSDGPLPWTVTCTLIVSRVFWKSRARPFEITGFTCMVRGFGLVWGYGENQSAHGRKTH